MTTAASVLVDAAADAVEDAMGSAAAAEFHCHTDHAHEAYTAICEHESHVTRVHAGAAHVCGV